MVRVPYVCIQTSAVSRDNWLDPSVTVWISYQQHPVSNPVTSILRAPVSLYRGVECYTSHRILMIEVYLDEKVLVCSPPETAGSPGENRPKPSRPDILLSSRYDGRCNIRHHDTRIQAPSGWRSQGWIQDAADKRSKRSRKGQANYLWIPRRSGHIYKGPSPLGGTLSHKHSPTPSLTGSPRHQWRNRPIQLPGRHQLQQLPQ